jgi:tryptophan synthase alpha chain
MLKRYINKPVFAGFGISTPKQARLIFKYVDGVIIGSAFIKVVSKYIKKQSILIKKIQQFVKGFINEAKNAEKN